MIKVNTILHLFSVTEASAPHEMCGMMFSEAFVKTVNYAKDPEHEFLIHHMDYLSACMIHDGKPWAIVHSHPTSGAAPSVKDCRLMDAFQVSGHDMAMVIVGLNPREIRIFRKRDDIYQLEWLWPIPAAGSV